MLTCILLLIICILGWKLLCAKIRLCNTKEIVTEYMEMLRYIREDLKTKHRVLIENTDKEAITLWKESIIRDINLKRKADMLKRIKKAKRVDWDTFINNLNNQ